MAGLSRDHFEVLVFHVASPAVRAVLPPLLCFPARQHGPHHMLAACHRYKCHPTCRALRMRWCRCRSTLQLPGAPCPQHGWTCWCSPTLPASRWRGACRWVAWHMCRPRFGATPPPPATVMPSTISCPATCWKQPKVRSCTTSKLFACKAKASGALQLWGVVVGAAAAAPTLTAMHGMPTIPHGRYRRLHLPPEQMLRGRAAYGLPRRGLVYACLHSAFKFHPSFDAVLAGILRRVPDAVIAVLEGRRPSWTAQVRSTRGGWCHSLC